MIIFMLLFIDYFKFVENHKQKYFTIAYETIKLKTVTIFTIYIRHTYYYRLFLLSSAETMDRPFTFFFFSFYIAITRL